MRLKYTINEFDKDAECRRGIHLECLIYKRSVLFNATTLSVLPLQRYCNFKVISKGRIKALKIITSQVLL